MKTLAAAARCAAFSGVWVTCAVGPALAAEPSGLATQLVGQASFRSWSLDDSDAEGWQFITPLDMAVSYQIAPDQRLDVSARGSYVVSENNTPGAKGRVSTFSDTTLGATYSVDITKDVQVFSTVDLNLDTGKATLRGRQKNAIMDPDLVDYVRFGEGFNFNVSVGVTYLIPDTGWSLTAAVGNNRRGSYVADGDLGEEFDPGNQTTVLGRVQYLKGNIYAALSFQYFDETTSTLAGLDYFNPGKQYQVNFEGTYVIDDKSSLSGAIFYATSEKNAYFDFFSDQLIEEAVDGNGDYVFGQLAYARVITPELGMTLSGTYGVRTENDYLPADDFFVPKRSYWSLSLSADYALDKSTTLGGSLTYGQVNDDETVFTNAESTYDTFTAAVSVSYAL